MKETRVKEEDVIAFARESFASLWELDLLLLLHASPDQTWAVDTAVAALRASRGAIDQAVQNLKQLTLVSVLDDDRIRYRGEGGVHAGVVLALAQLWKEKPLAVINAIYAGHSGQPLREFSNAFKLKD